MSPAASVGRVSEFTPLRESELDRLGNEALVDYIAAAREAADHEAERRAVGVLAFAFEDTIRAWVRKDMGSAPQDVDDVVMEVMQSAIRSSFEGKVVGEFGSFLRTISARRVVDHFRRRGRRPEESPLPEEHEGDEEIWGQGGRARTARPPSRCVTRSRACWPRATRCTRG